MSSRKLTVNELLWLILPAAILAGTGWYFMRQPNTPESGPESGAWRLVVDEVKIVPITPREVAEGYDTKVTVRAHGAGVPVVPAGYRSTGGGIIGRNIRLVYHKGGREQLIYSARQPEYVRGTSRAGNDDIVFKFTMKLASLPVSTEAVTLKADIFQRSSYITNRRVAAYIDSKPAPISFVVRKPGEKTPPPAVSKYRPFAVQSMGINNKLMPPTVGNVTVAVELAYRSDMPETEKPKPEDKGYWYGPTYLEDERGRKYSRFKATGRKFPTSLYPVVKTPANRDKDGNWIFAFMYDVPISQVPASAGKLTFKSAISVDNYWPVPVSVVVRAK